MCACCCVLCCSAVRQIRFKSSKFEIRHDEVQQLEVELGALAAPGMQPCPDWYPLEHGGILQSPGILAAPVCSTTRAVAVTTRGSICSSCQPPFQMLCTC